MSSVTQNMIKSARLFQKHQTHYTISRMVLPVKLTFTKKHAILGVLLKKYQKYKNENWV